MYRNDTIPDEALWRQAAAGDVDAEEALVKRYAPLVRACARPYFLVGAEGDDLIQEGMMGLLSAIRRFDPARDAKFRTYAELCIRSRLYSAIKTATRSKHSPLNESLSLESPLFDESRTTGTARWLRDPEELVITRELTDEITGQGSGSLSRFENEVLGYYLEGMSYADIAARTDKSVKSVDNAVQRIRKKLAKFL